jgi:hypothetical protein
VSCSEYWGIELGMALMKYFDTIYFIGNGMNTLIIYLLPGEINYANIFILCIGISIVNFCLIPFFPKVQK